MGNISYIIPTVNKADFNQETIVDLIGKAFPKVKLELHETGQIIVTKNDNSVMEMWMDEGCYLLQDEGDKEDPNQQKIDQLHLDPNQICLGASYGWQPLSDKTRTKILTYIVDHFKGYWLDEGIHPEFISHTDEFLNKYR